MGDGERGSGNGDQGAGRRRLSSLIPDPRSPIPAQRLSIPDSRPSPSYAELHCLSNFSFLRGASHPEELVARAAELGYDAIAITDRNSLAGVVRAHVAAKEHNIHLIIGAEITPTDAPPIVLLATNRSAYGRLARLITRGRLRTKKGDCAIELADIAELSAGLIGIAVPGSGIGDRGAGIGDRGSGCWNRRSPAPKVQIGERKRTHTADFGLAIGDWRLAIDPLPAPRFPLPVPRFPFPAPRSPLPSSLRRYKQIFGDQLYLAAELCCDEPDERRFVRLAELSRAAGVPLVACNAVHYHAPERRYLHDVLTCIRERCALSEAGSHLSPNAERHLRSLNEIARRYAGYERAVATSARIARRCTFTLDELRYEYPHEVVPEGCSAIEYLERLTWAGAAEKYGNGEQGSGIGDRGPERRRLSSLIPDPRSPIPPPPSPIPAAIRKLLTAELKLIRELHYEHYFLTVHDLVRFARSRGILCQGRGSAANSAVCYCLGVTAVDPAKIDLLFERFISKERDEPPDIDIDFEHERREEVFQYIYQKYGRERAAITAEVITYRPRSAIRDVGKVLGLSLDLLDVLAKSVAWRDKEALPEESLRNAGIDPNDRTIRMLSRLVKQLLGFPRHLSQHVGGFVITESPLCEIVPLENGAMPGRTFIEWDKDDIDALGILKVDCLALGMLTAISKCFALLRGLARGSGIGDRGAGNGERGTGIGERGMGIGTIENRTSAGVSARRIADSARESGSERSITTKGKNHGELIPRVESLAAGNRVGERYLQTDQQDAGRREIRPDQPDASLHRLGPEQHRRGQRAQDAQGLHLFPDHCTRFTRRTRNATDHCAGASDASRSEANLEINRRGNTNAPSVDQQLAANDVNEGGSGSGDRGTGSGERGPERHRLSSPIPDPRSPIPVPQSLSNIPSEDPAVYDMICAADTVGVFQIESRAQMSMLP